MKNFKNKLSSGKGKLNGGFSSLNENQLSKIKGGVKDLDSTNFICGNTGNCTGSTNTKVCE